jgi:perosamine synthetase
VGTEADLSVFAFYPNKQITTGEGGMVLSKDETMTRDIRSMRNQGRAEDTQELEHVRLGYNYRIDELSAALGLAQMNRIEEIVERRMAVARRYDNLLEDVEEVRPLWVDPSVEKSPFVYVVRATSREMRNRIMAALRVSGIDTRIYFCPIHMQPYYVERFGYREGTYPEAEALFHTTLALPFYNRLSEKEQGVVVNKIKEGASKGKRV